MDKPTLCPSCAFRAGNDGETPSGQYCEAYDSDPQPCSARREIWDAAVAHERARIEAKLHESDMHADDVAFVLGDTPRVTDAPPFPVGVAPSGEVIFEHPGWTNNGDCTYTHESGATVCKIGHEASWVGVDAENMGTAFGIGSLEVAMREALK
jgi:hypothetical protein